MTNPAHSVRKSKMLGQPMLWNLVLSSTKLQRCSKLTWSFVSISDYRRHPSRVKSVPPFEMASPPDCQLSLFSSGLPQHCLPQHPNECIHMCMYTHLHIQRPHTPYCSYLHSSVSHFNFYLSDLLSLHQLTYPSINIWRIQVGILSHSNPAKTFFTIVDSLISFKLFIKYQNEAYLDHSI